MAIRNLIEQIATGWPAYSQKGLVDKRDAVHELVTKKFPRELAPLVAANDAIVLRGSTGAGNITAAPWIALLDKHLTTSATSGYYVVYLFSTDLSAVTLCMAFGTTQFEEQFGSAAKAFPRMRFAPTTNSKVSTVPRARRLLIGITTNYPDSRTRAIIHRAN